jgi:hypothetical protein
MGPHHKAPVGAERRFVRFTPLTLGYFAVASSVPESVSARLAGSGSARRSTCGFPVAYRAAPATYAATMYVAWRSRDARARS